MSRGGPEAVHGAEAMPRPAEPARQNFDTLKRRLFSRDRDTRPAGSTVGRADAVNAEPTVARFA
jgi:hypothetical protein